MTFSQKFQHRSRQAGDTLIEVMLAIVVLSMVLTGAYAAMNGGLRISQNSIERTQASDVARGQAEALRTLRDLHSTNATAATAWANVTNKITNISPSTNPCTGGGTPTVGSNSFWINNSANPIAPTSGTQSQNYLKYWIEAYQPSGVTSYVDFYVRGCWQGIGSSEGIQNTSIVIRLVTS